jgi:hypothetical protein
MGTMAKGFLTCPWGHWPVILSHEHIQIQNLIILYFILEWKIHFVHCRMFNSILDLYFLVVNSIKVVTMKRSLDIAKCPLYMRITGHTKHIPTYSTWPKKGQKEEVPFSHWSDAQTVLFMWFIQKPVSEGVQVI